jgi:hypothetical protein
MVSLIVVALLFLVTDAILIATIRHDRKIRRMTPGPVVPVAPVVPSAQPPVSTLPAPTTPPPTATPPTVTPPHRPPPVVSGPPKPVLPPNPKPAAPGVRVRADDLAQYLDVWSKALHECRQYNPGTAADMIRSWIRDHAENEWKDMAGRDLERVELVSRLWQKLSNLGREVRGRKLSGPDAENIEIVSINNGEVTLSRRLGGSGSAQYGRPLSQLAPEDILALIPAADPAQAPIHQAAWSIVFTPPANAATVSARVPPLSTEGKFIQQWIAEWQANTANASAGRALDDLKRLVQISRFTEAAVLQSRMESAYAQTDILKWARRPEFQELSQIIREEKNAQDEPAADRTPSPPVESAPVPIPAGLAKKEPIEIGIGDLFGRWNDYDGELVRVRFQSATEIRLISGGRFSARIGQKWRNVRVEFSKDGEDWMRRIPENDWKFENQRDRFVYGMVRAEDETIQLIGKTRNKRMGGIGYEYKW